MKQKKKLEIVFLKVLSRLGRESCNDPDNNDSSTTLGGTGLAHIYVYNPDSFSNEPLLDDTGTNSGSSNGGTAVLGQAFEVLSADIDEFINEVEGVSYKPKDISWLAKLRRLSESLNDLKDVVSEALWLKLNAKLDAAFKTALNIYAEILYPDVARVTEVEKEFEFLVNSEHTIAILLYEFANGKGPALREFSNGQFWSDYFTDERVANIKSNFEQDLLINNLTFDQFVANGNVVESSYNFSPDHAGLINSLEEHLNANLVQFFVGGSKVEYTPSDREGYIRVLLKNPTSRNSLLLHAARDYERPIVGGIPLSTIWQEFYIHIKVK